jgi:hypothetical protein
MNWDAIGAVGEIIGALAVVASLVYLAIQIRSQNRETRMLAVHETSTAFRESIGVFSDPAKAEIYIRGNADFESLTDTEKFVLIAGMQGILRVWEEAYHQHQAGRLPNQIWDVMSKQYAAVISGQSLANVWELRKDFFDPNFREFVDSLERVAYVTK